jgi:biopolymer transport protein ExbD
MNVSPVPINELVGTCFQDLLTNMLLLLLVIVAGNGALVGARAARPAGGTQSSSARALVLNVDREGTLSVGATNCISWSELDQKLDALGAADGQVIISIQPQSPAGVVHRILVLAQARPRVQPFIRLSP